MKIGKTLRWALWAGLCGVGLATVIVVLFPYLRDSLAFDIFFSANRLGFFIANWATALVFHGDRMSYPIINISEFFDLVFILAAALQTALLGACLGFLLNRKPSPRAPI
ncbi:MAG: hypothetical protein P4N24_01600 [Acidobacteriota bacterium]|nr:hypothetical protein [Acidobacteriota bacterium]